MARRRKWIERVRETPREFGPPKVLSATEAARNFSEILNRVKYRGESFILVRGGVTVAELRPATPIRFKGTDLAALLRSLPPIDEEFLRTVEDVARSQPVLPESPWGP
jgi:antitoxin (DNA-binding transcriptional repressor) of toxin-antitoxin stability system